MAKEMLINVSEGEECRIALLEDGRLDELYMERTSATSHVGNIYKGRVTNVEPSIQAAFIDFGLGRNGFLHISDLMPTYFGRRGEDIQETVGRKMARRDRPPIQRCLRRGDDIVVQIIKEGIGTKGPTLSTYLSIPGRILVMMPGMGKMGVSRKIEDDEERRRLRQILDSLKPPKDVGFIIRTAGVGKTKTEIQRDLTYLTRLWQNFEKKRESTPAPVELYTEGDLVTRTVRDLFSADVDRIVIDSKEVAKRIKEVIKLANPRAKNKVDLYEEPVPLFHQYNIEREIEQMYSRHVPLPSGGSLVIDSTEAIVAIDVNSGKFRDHSDAEMTAFKTDMEAADEIPRQLRLRDLGGVIICDFIDLRYERHRRELEERLHDNFKDDRAKTKVLRMSQFGIIEMTRQRMRPSLKRSIYFDCPHCKGAGLVKTHESMSLDVMRRLAIAVNDLKVARVELAVCPEVSFYLLNRRRQQIVELEERTKKRVVIRSEPTLGLDEMKLDLYDNRDGLVVLDELGMTLPALPHRTQLSTKPQPRPLQGARGGRFDDRRQRGDTGRRPPSAQGGPQREEEEDRYDSEPSQDSIEDRTDAFEDDAQEIGAASPAETEEDSLPLPPGVDTEAASEAALEPGEVERANNGEGDEQGGPRRRRRRRGRRGRGRGRGAQQDAAQGAAAQASSPSSDREQDESREDRSADEPPVDADMESIVEEDVIESDEFGGHVTQSVQTTSYNAGPRSATPQGAGEEEGGPRRRRRRRGGRGRGRRKPDENGQPQPPSAEGAAKDDSKRAPEPEPIQKRERAPRAEPPPVARTGSTDRHLIEDEPVLPEPVRRPRSYRDLDQVPDDFD